MASHVWLVFIVAFGPSKFAASDGGFTPTNSEHSQDAAHTDALRQQLRRALPLKTLGYTVQLVGGDLGFQRAVVAAELGARLHAGGQHEQPAPSAGRKAKKKKRKHAQSPAQGPSAAPPPGVGVQATQEVSDLVAGAHLEAWHAGTRSPFYGHFENVWHSAAGIDVCKVAWLDNDPVNTHVPAFNVWRPEYPRPADVEAFTARLWHVGEELRLRLESLMFAENRALMSTGNRLALIGPDREQIIRRLEAVLPAFADWGAAEKRLSVSAGQELDTLMNECIVHIGFAALVLRLAEDRAAAEAANAPELRDWLLEDKTMYLQEYRYNATCVECGKYCTSRHVSTGVRCVACSGRFRDDTRKRAPEAEESDARVRRLTFVSESPERLFFRREDAIGSDTETRHGPYPKAHAPEHAASGSLSPTSRASLDDASPAGKALPAGVLTDPPTPNSQADDSRDSEVLSPKEVLGVSP